MEEAVRSLLTLLDGTVSEAAARGALARVGGSIEGAVRLLFEGSAAGPAAEAAASQPRQREPAVIDVEEGGGGGGLPEVPRPSYLDLGSAATAPSRPAAPAVRRPRTVGAAEDVSLALLQREQKRPRVAGPAPARAAAEQLRAAAPRSQPLSQSSAAAPQPPVGNSANEGYEFPNEDSAWTLFSPSSPSSAIGDLAWQKEILEEDPPCLTLRGFRPEHAPRTSDGKMHSGAKAPRDTTDNLELGLREDTVHLGGRFGLRTKRLRLLFDDLLSKVRYPPGGALECSWRIVELSERPGQRIKVTPSDLVGSLPERPFKLLDNRGDTPAAQPPRFAQHQLRPEQLRSLAWMLAREGAGGREDDEQDEDEPFVVEWRRYWNPDGFEDSEQDAGQFIPGAQVRIREGATGGFYTLDNRPVMALPSGIGVCLGPHKGGQYEDCVMAEFITDPHATAFTLPKIQLLCPVDELEFVDDGEIKVGCRVRVASHVKKPSYGWGGVTPGMVGVVEKADPEMLTIRFPVHASWKGRRVEIERADAVASLDDGPRFVVDLRVRACYHVRGGILADKVGYGKTATTIGLIDATLSRPVPEMPEYDQGDFIPAKGTLIIVPSNLYEQWLTEISKFVWEGKPLKSKLQQGWSPKGCPMRIFAMSNVTPLTKVRAEDLAEADVVVCSYRLLFSPIYQDRRSELAGGTSTLASLVAETRSLIAGTSCVRSGRKGTNFVQRWQDLQFPILEQFHWRRVVFDEFHELESFDSLQQNSLQHLRASYRWGLTGTPPVDCNAGVIFMSSLFRIDLPGYLSEVTTRAGHPSGCPELTPWESDRLLTESAGRYLDYYARQNTAELPHIRLQEHVVVVHHTSNERALYLGQAHDAPDVADPEAFKSDENTQALERLLKLCSHFQAAGDNMASAKEECERIGEQKERRLVRARNQVERCCRAILLLEDLRRAAAGGRTAAPAASEAWRAELSEAEARLAKEGDAAARTVEALKKAWQDAGAEARALWIETLDPHRPRDVQLATHLGPPDSKRGYATQWKLFSQKRLPMEEVEELLRGQAKEQAQNLQELHDAGVSFEFFRRTVTALARDDSPEARSCSICFGEGLPLTKLAITPCAHAFCVSCLEAIVGKLGRCSLCNHKLTQKDIRPLAQEIPFVSEGSSSGSSSSASSSSSAPAPPAGDAAPEAADTSNFSKYGTKLAAVVRKLQQLRIEDPSAKVILFVQFDDLKRKVASALDEFGIPALQLHGAVAQRSAVIRDWQHNPTSEAFVLLLSLAQSASGTNLTAASHVVFLHPMLAATPERAVAHELQAIGRARRHGQRKDVVHVWRFVTAGTLEQTLTERHQSALWTREQARELAAAAGGAAASEGA